MSKKPDYPKRFSDIEITFLDGEMITHRVSFGSSFAPFLSQQSGETGILTLLCGRKTYSYPLTAIRGWAITEVEEDSTIEHDRSGE